MHMKRYMRPQSNPRKTLILILIAGTLMVGIKFLLWEMEPSSDSLSENSPPSPVYVPVEEVLPEDEYMQAPEAYGPVLGDSFVDEYFEEETVEAVISRDLEVEPPNTQKTASVIHSPPIEERAVFENPAVVIVIDDMGVDRNRSRAIMDLPAPLTLAFLPYATGLDEITEEARSRGHELMIHMPMEPMNPDLDVGRLALLEDMTEEQLEKMFSEIFASFSGYVGVNNHMGSRLTQNPFMMARVMKELDGRGLFFLDSKTIHTSVAGDVAAAQGLQYAERDVFLDHDTGYESVVQSLQKAERIARLRGVAIAIGHPKDHTIAALKEWIPEAQKRGVRIIPASRAVRRAPAVNRRLVSYGPERPPQP